MKKQTSEFRLITGVAVKVILLMLGVQLLFWSLLFIFPDTISKNIAQELGYEFIDKISSDSTKFNHKKILVLGDSSAATAIHLSELGNNAVTLGVWGSSPAESYFYLKQYLDTHSAPKCLLFTHLMAPEYYKAHAFWEFVVNFSKMPLSFVSEIYNESKRLGTFPGSEYDPISFYTKYFLIRFKIFFAAQEVYQEKLRFSFSFRELYGERLRALHSSGGEFIMNTRGRNAKGAWWEFLVNPLSEDKFFEAYVEKIFKLAEEKKMKIYTFSPPFSRKAYFDYTPRIDSLDNYFKEITSKHPSATYLDLREFYPPNHYIDHAHLNTLGSERFTQKIKEQLDCYN